MARLDHINLTVGDLDESIRWYNEIFGFENVESGRYPNGMRWAILAQNDSMIAICEDARRKPADKTADRSRHSLIHFGLRIDDVEDWKRKLSRPDIGLDHTARYPNSLSWYVRDPSGHEIEVSYAGGKPLVFSN